MNQSMKALIENFFIQTGRDATICPALIDIFEPLMDFIGYEDKDLRLEAIEELEDTIETLRREIQEMQNTPNE